VRKTSNCAYPGLLIGGKVTEYGVLTDGDAHVLPLFDSAVVMTQPGWQSALTEMVTLEFDWQLPGVEGVTVRQVATNALCTQPVMLLQGVP
jgi:hypothetical protein